MSNLTTNYKIIKYVPKTMAEQINIKEQSETDRTFMVHTVVLNAKKYNELVASGVFGLKYVTRVITESLNQ